MHAHMYVCIYADKKLYVYVCGVCMCTRQHTLMALHTPVCVGGQRLFFFFIIGHII